MKNKSLLQKKNDSGLSTEKGESFEKVAVGEKYGKGYSTQSLYNFRLFYESFLNQRISPQCGEI